MIKGLSCQPASKEKKEILITLYFEKALASNKKTAATFNAFSYSHKKEYVEWIAGAKTEETRNKRMAQAIKMMTDGKSRDSNYAAK